MDRGDALEAFHPRVREWFLATYGAPTDVQARAWPLIAEGRHALVTAPTGSGKTLTAFLWALNQLIVGAWTSGRLRVLYVSPLKALNNDIQRNLIGPLQELSKAFIAAGEDFPPIRVLTRSGDTPADERRRMMLKPPEILITTPESLNLLLCSPRARQMLTGVQSVILDEIHAVAGTKRGTHLITAVDRLVPLAGEFQRIALSATVKPLEAVARFVGGYEMRETGGEGPLYGPRAVAIVESPAAKQYEIEVRFPHEQLHNPEGGSRWPELVEELKGRIAQNRSTLIFTNGRRMCERLSLMLNEDEPELLAYSHHGSLSREMRHVVEQRLKDGRLAAIVSTSSLELGIDIGELDEVLLVGTPNSVASTLQRIGRAGHRVGQVSRGALYPTHAHDLLDAAVMAEAVDARDIEAVEIVEAPLDVLAQIIVAMTSVETWEVDALYNRLRASAPYRRLSRALFDQVLSMTAGRYANARLRALDPLVSVDGVDNTVTARKGALQLLYNSGGTIPDRGYFALRNQETGAKVGELDEEFVWERFIGETFTFGTQVWKIHTITHNDVLARPVPPQPGTLPFWKAEGRNRRFHLSERKARFLEWLDSHADNEGLADELRVRGRMTEHAADALVEYVRRMREHTRADLPHRHHVLIELCDDHRRAEDRVQVIVHTLWGGAVNRPLVLALAQAWEDRFGERAEAFATDDCLVIAVPREHVDVDPFELIAPSELESLLRRRLERTGFFGARFRESAGRALLITRQKFGKRMPLWVSRVRSKQLLDEAAKHEDFPIVTETWRMCLRDEFELEILRALLDEVRAGAIHVTRVRTEHPSPFAESVAWQQTNKYMYASDAFEGPLTTNLREDIIKESVFSAELRPRVAAEIVAAFQSKLHRTHDGYAPSSAADLLAWVKERLFIPAAEWRMLLEGIERDCETNAQVFIDALGLKLVTLDGARPGVAALEMMGRLNAAFAEDTDSAELSAWLSEWLRFYGPIPPEAITVSLGLAEKRVAELIESLEIERAVIMGTLVAGDDAIRVCDAENFERLLRIARAAARADTRALPAERLQPFLAARQGLGDENESINQAVAPLLGLAMAPEALEREFIPARHAKYAPQELESAARQTGLFWLGLEDRRIVLATPETHALFASEREDDEQARAAAPIPSAVGRFTLNELIALSGLSSSTLTGELWNAVWRGVAANDSFDVLRRGVETKFTPSEVPSPGKISRRSGMAAWKATRPFEGHWRMLPKCAPPEDALDALELEKDRVRLLLERYGIVFRELLRNELPPLRWGPLFRALRLMELSGEILAGQFFEGIGGLQFISREGLKNLQTEAGHVYWLNAADPTSLCGLGIKDLPYELPARKKSGHLVFHGARLVLVSERSGKALTIRVSVDDEDLPAYFGPLRNMVERSVSPKRSIELETINGEVASDSEYLAVLRRAFQVVLGPNGVSLWKSR